MLCYMVCYAIWYATIRYDTIRYDAMRCDAMRCDTMPGSKSCFRVISMFQKSRKISLEPVRHPQKVSMCHLKVIPIHFLEPKIRPLNQKFHLNCSSSLPTPKIPSITRGLLGITRDRHGIKLSLSRVVYDPEVQECSWPQPVKMPVPDARLLIVVLLPRLP